MKDYLSYRMMQEFGVDAPLCSYAYITVNGEEWGLYLAVEGVEEMCIRDSDTIVRLAFQVNEALKAFFLDVYKRQ